MPNYDYNCKFCQETIEVFQKITEEPLSVCPKCHNEGFERCIGGGSATFCFKGSGFYIKDYKSSGCGCAATHTCSTKKD